MRRRCAAGDAGNRRRVGRDGGDAVTVQWVLAVNERTGLQVKGIIGRSVEVARIYSNHHWASTVTLIIDLPGVVKKSTHATLQDAEAAGAARIAAWFAEVTA